MKPAIQAVILWCENTQCCYFGCTVHIFVIMLYPSKLNSVLFLSIIGVNRCFPSVADVKDNKVLIHFDGWTSRYDYWTETTDTDLHPVGYMGERGHAHSGNTSLQKPKGESGY